ncbi:MAG: class I SAM-dependent methyltransferase [Proteobacteria bacterium]|nr:class I SAM-dependent methyltransferase [Pseudomonadota bacterium]
MHSPGHYVPETRFGEWFQRTEIWRRYVVAESVAELAALLPANRPPCRAALDAGCGDGAAFEALLATFAPASLQAIDVDAASAAAATARAATLGAPIEVRRGDASALPYASASFDLVVCHQLLHHASEPRAVLAEFHRVLAPGGWLLVSESCRRFLRWWPVRLLFRHPPRPQQTADDYAAMVRIAGFEVDPARIATPAPWWSLPDLGLRARLGRDVPSGEATQVRIAARRP